MLDRPFDQDKIKELKRLEEFDYYGFDIAPSAWEKLIDKVNGWIKQFLNLLADQFDWHIDPIIFQLLFYGIIIFGIIFLILKLMGVEMRSFIPFRKSKIRPQSYHVFHEDIDQIDFESRIKEAQSNGNYALMIRYRYLSILKLLADKTLVTYELRKTNAEYAMELQNHPVNTNFINMAQIFERVWYGRIEASEQANETMEMNFQQVKEILN